MRAKRKILIIDDDASHRLMLKEALAEEGYAAAEAGTGEGGLEEQRTDPSDLVLLDLKMPGIGGLETLRLLKAYDPSLPVLIMTAYAAVDTAVQALKKGAYDYLTKPLDIHELKEAVRAGLEPEDDYRLAGLPEELRRTGIVSTSSVMEGLLTEIARVAPTDATVLLTGESGTGKEILAEAIHMMSPRRDLNMIRLNCAAIPENLVESELFGHRKGSFTGAERDKEGKFVAARDGTLFLDEVGDLPAPAQAKVLRVLQDGVITPLGDNREIITDVRIIAATNRDLEVEVRAGRFREDLFYRLSVFPVRVPPLRERKIDIPLLADLFLKRFARRHGKDIHGISPRALACLVSYDWPGNVREMMNVIERGVILSRGRYLGEEDLPEPLAGKQVEAPPGLDAVQSGISLKEMERMLIERTLAEKEGNRTHTARTLGITRKTLLAKIKEYGIEG
ncbi:MAG: sigma-54-dependent Fis family transcriptional regulator [bacterium]|nr:MAG: sigma-54-dependent Fis family transcriptional regulator [bacterium]